MPKDWLKLAGAAGLTIACGPRVELAGESSGSSDGLGSTTSGAADDGPDVPNPSEPGTTSTVPGTSGGTDSSPADSGFEDSAGFLDDGGCPFFACPDGGGVTLECDVWVQDCPRGDKCAPWANDGGPRWNATKCVPVAEGAGQPGDTCTVEGSAASGIDSCDLGSTCMFVTAGENVGTCIADCRGTEGDPVCTEAGTACTVAYDGVIHQCLPTCNPLLADCERGDCHANGEDGFTCGPTVEPPLAIGESCLLTTRWDCVGGSTCIEADRLLECAEGACCTPWCDVTLEDACPAPTTCVPWFTDRPPAGLETVGVCALW